MSTTKDQLHNSSATEKKCPRILKSKERVKRR